MIIIIIIIVISIIFNIIIIIVFRGYSARIRSRGPGISLLSSGLSSKYSIISIINIIIPIIIIINIITIVIITGSDTNSLFQSISDNSTKGIDVQQTNLPGCRTNPPKKK